VVLSCSDGEVAVIADQGTMDACLKAAGIELKSSTRQKIVDELVMANIPAAPVRTVDEVGASERGHFIRMVKKGENLWPLLELPFKLSRMQKYDLRPIEALGGANKDFVRRA
jgi:crotonobetainyl-CoA:carnitine CoA-transferase CaiB-like acyl-CoA transferase